MRTRRLVFAFAVANGIAWLTLEAADAATARRHAPNSANRSLHWSACRPLRRVPPTSSRRLAPRASCRTAFRGIPRRRDGSALPCCPAATRFARPAPNE
ncbi:hypothetical protein WS67_20255 [Burkholderia singularis]|uniref:Secreted protein n=1 Tax=Burkholderia singularis TaxID=1503053 RepID=A0A103DY75_9BURK|nr:hypothetical protein WS67_20255 [Burkholderia singularis]